MNFCIDCGKEINLTSKRCRSCAQKHNWKNRTKINFSDKEKNQMASLFEDGMILSEIAKIFNYSTTPIGRTLIDFLGKEKYKEIAKEHLRESRLKNLKKAGEVAWSLPRSEKQLKAVRENGRENVKKAHEASAKGIWISSPEHRFFLICLSKMFFLKDIEKQYYLKGLNHAFDFAIPKFKLLFEIDGDYWHRDRKERDTEIDNFAKSEGWTVIRFNDAKLRELEIF